MHLDKTKDDIEWSLARSAKRRQEYDANGDARSAAIERHVSDRLLAEWVDVKAALAVASPSE